MKIVANSKFPFIDNVNGLGAVPLNQDVNYFGFSVLMKPSTFLELALPLSEIANSTSYLIKHLQEGKKVGTPFLQIAIPNEWKDGNFEEPAKVNGHEGRHRMIAIRKVFGNDFVPVHLFFDGLRARNISAKMLKELQRGMLSQATFSGKGSKYIKGPLFKI